MMHPDEKLVTLTVALAKFHGKTPSELSPEERALLISRALILLDKLRLRRLVEGGPKVDYGKIKAELPVLYQEFKKFIDSGVVEPSLSAEEKFMFKILSRKIRYWSFASALIGALIAGNILLFYGNVWMPFFLLAVSPLIGQLIFLAFSHPLRYGK